MINEEYVTIPISEQKPVVPAKHGSFATKCDILEQAIKVGGMSLFDAIYLLDLFRKHEPMIAAEIYKQMENKK